MTQIEFMNRLIDKHAPAVIGCTYNILFTNDIAITTVIEAVEAVRKSDRYRQETKRITNVIDRLRGKYEKMLFEVIGDRSGFFADANEAFLEDVQKHVDILYYSIKGGVRQGEAGRFRPACTLRAGKDDVRVLLHTAGQEGGRAKAGRFPFQAGKHRIPASDRTPQGA